MKTPRARILLVEKDPEIREIVGRQTLQPVGYRVDTATSAAAAIEEVYRSSPDLVIADLDLPGLSGKDLLVALRSQGVDVPAIVIAAKGMESDVIQAFRLGAADYLLWPAREAEILAAVERVLGQLRSSQEREDLQRQVRKANEELQRRVRELTTILGIGKAVTSITERHALFQKIIEGGIYVTEADAGWLLIREDSQNPFILSAQHNLPEKIARKVGKPWDDGISSLVALSGESLSIHGEPLARFTIYQLGKSALVVPLKIQKEVVGLLVVQRKDARPFSPNSKSLLEAVADYASISLMNARLFQALEERAHSLQGSPRTSFQTNEATRDDLLRMMRTELSPQLQESIETIQRLLVGEGSRLNATQKGVLRSVEEKLIRMDQVLTSSQRKLERL